MTTQWAKPLPYGVIGRPPVGSQHHCLQTTRFDPWCPLHRELSPSSQATTPWNVLKLIYWRFDTSPIIKQSTKVKSKDLSPLHALPKKCYSNDRTGESRDYQQVKRISKRPTLKSAMPRSRVQCPFCKKEFNCALGDFRIGTHRTLNGLPCMGSGGAGTPRG